MFSGNRALALDGLRALVVTFPVPLEIFSRTPFIASNDVEPRFFVVGVGFDFFLKSPLVLA